MPTGGYARLAAAVEDAIPLPSGGSGPSGSPTSRCSSPDRASSRSTVALRLPAVVPLSRPAHRERDVVELHQHERATAHVLGATFGRADLEHVANGRLLFVRCPRAYLVGDLPIRGDRTAW